MKDTNTVKNIIILGAGYGGVKAAFDLHKKLKRNKNYRIVLIDKNPFHTLMTELHEVAGGRIEPDSLRIYLKKIFAGTSVEIITDEVYTIDFPEKKIISEHNIYKYDYLVIATGAEPVFFGIPGVKENCLTLWSLDDAVKIREHIEKMFLYASREVNPEKRKAFLTFIVAGAGLTGIELVGEFVEWKNILCDRFFIDRDDVTIKLIEAKSSILPTLPEKLQKKAKKFLEKKKVKILTDKAITEVKDNTLVVNSGEQSIRSETIIWTCGVEGGAFGGNLKLTKGKFVYWDCEHAAKSTVCKKIDCKFQGTDFIQGKHARVQVNEQMQSIDFPEVYITGDIVWFKEKDNAIPQIVETALQTAAITSKNIYNDIKGKEKVKFKSNYHGQMVSLGSKYCVANLMNFKFSGFMAMIMKHLVNIHYLFGIGGFNIIWDYIRHHFLDIKDKRSMVGGHGAGKTRFYWIILLRLFLGAMWIIEGGTKVYNGWLDPKNIFIVQMPPQDGVTSATSTATTEEQDPNSTEVPDSTTTATATIDTESTKYMPKPLIKPLGIYKWFEQAVIVKFAFIFQDFVVITEILIGLALIGGLFTFIASAGSIGLSIMFIISGMASKEIFWFIFAAIVMMGGAGKSAGLDYWVMPWFKKIWNSMRIAWKTNFYIDNPVFKQRKKGDTK